MNAVSAGKTTDLASGNQPTHPFDILLTGAAIKILSGDTSVFPFMNTVGQ